jgi:hypothetical protein
MIQCGKVKTNFPKRGTKDSCGTTKQYKRFLRKKIKKAYVLETLKVSKT